MEEKELVKMIPPAPSDLAAWLHRKGCFQKNWLIFRCGWWADPLSGGKSPCLNVVCTACGEHFKVLRTDTKNQPYQGNIGSSHIEDGEETICPECGAPVKGCHIGMVEQRCREYEWPLVFSRCGKALVAASYRVWRSYGKNGKQEIRIDKYEAVVFIGKRAYRMAGWVSTGMMFGARDYLNQWVMRKRYSDEYGNGKYIYPMEHVFRGTPFEHCRLTQYMRLAWEYNHPITYLRMFQQHPQIENLIVQGYGKLVKGLVESKCSGQQHYIKGAVDWKEFSPRKMLGLSKPEFEFLRGKGIDAENLSLYRKLRDKLSGHSVSEIYGILHDFQYWCRDMLKYPDTERIMRYCKKQAKRQKQAPGTVCTLWVDYIRMAGKIGSDVENPEIRFPPRLNAAHERATMAEKFQQCEKLRKQFEKMYQITAPLAWEKDGLMIRPAKTEEELIIEGAKLHHCVGGYGEQHCGGRPIFFIRRTDEPDVPYYTLQLDIREKRVIQIHGDHNNLKPYPPKPPEIDAFGEEWCEQVVRAAGRKRQVSERIRMRATA